MLRVRCMVMREEAVVMNGVFVRIWASGVEQGTDTTGNHSSRPGYWEWIFGQGTATQGEVALGESRRQPALATYPISTDIGL